jgi:hypothetical protein
MHPGTATRHTASDQATLLRWAPTLPPVLWLWTPPPYSRGLRCHHASHGSRPHPTSEMGSGIAIWHMAPDLVATCKRAPALARVPWHSVSHGRENKERLSRNGRVERLACY